MAWIFTTVVSRERENELPPWPVIVLGILGIAVMGVDGVTSYAGLRQTTNDIRLATGLAAGAGLAVLLVPMFNYQVWRQSANKPVLSKWWQWSGLVLLLVAAYWLVKSPGPWLFFLPALVGLTVIGVFAIVNVLILTIIPFFQQKADNWWQLWPLALSGLALAGIELWLSAEFHAFALSWALRARS